MQEKDFHMNDLADVLRKAPRRDLLEKKLKVEYVTSSSEQFNASFIPWTEQGSSRNNRVSFATADSEVCFNNTRKSMRSYSWGLI